MEKATFCGELKVLQRLSEYEFGVELWIMRDGVNNNNWDFRNLEENYLTFVGQPILCAYVGSQIGDGHNMTERLGRDGNTYYSFTDGTAERIVGTLSEDEGDFSLRDRDGHTWVVAKGRLFAFYAPELVDKIVRTGRMDVSAETEIKRGETTDGKVEVFYEWTGLGVTILGDDVAPAIPGANIAALAAMQDEFKSLKLKAASLRLASETKPQKKQPTNKGGTKHMNKQAIARLAPKFEGYKIVALSDDGMSVALVDKHGAAYTYSFNAEDKGEVIQSKIEPANVGVSFAFGEDALMADMSDILEYAVNEARVEDAKIEALQEQLTKVSAELATMKQAEHDRRVDAVKETLKRTLSEIREVASEAEDDLEDAVKKMEEKVEEYAAMEADGKFCGDTQARAELLAMSAEDRIAKARQAAAERNNRFAWNDLQNANNHNEGGIEEMLAFING